MASAPHWRGDRAGRFYVAMAFTACAAVAIGFSTTYFLPLARGGFAGPTVAHVHGLLFMTWVALLLVQGLLVRRRNTRLHRKLGLVALPLALAMAASGLGIGVHAVTRDLAAGGGAEAVSQLMGVATAMATFVLYVAIALALRKQPDWHKRMILLATIAILWPAWFRFRHLMPWLPRPDIWLAIVVSDSLILIAMLRDKVKFGRVHPAYLIFGLLLIADHVGETLLYDGPAWRVAAQALYGLLT
ncbi:hypothetical protein [Allosphingosinicella sp.]|uniref:hypothetical protein n=1 Tax=Allosphingosinicella sp. TaxID=2823234 RepID=UPI003782F888